MTTNQKVSLTVYVLDTVVSYVVLFCNYFHPSGPVDVQWTSIERPYWTSGRPKGTFNGRLVDVPNETQLVRPNRTKMDVQFRPSRDDGHGT